MRKGSSMKALMDGLIELNELIKRLLSVAPLGLRNAGRRNPKPKLWAVIDPPFGRREAFLLVVMILLSCCAAQAATNDLTSTLQQGLFEEEANHNYQAAIKAYEAVIASFDSNRNYAATAIFRLGEIYRKQGKTNEAAAQYERVLREFSDQSAFVSLSRERVPVGWRG